MRATFSDLSGEFSLPVEPETPPRAATAVPLSELWATAGRWLTGADSGPLLNSFSQTGLMT